MAFVIVSAGTATMSPPRTIGLRPLVLGGGVAMLVVMAACVAGGYLAGRVHRDELEYSSPALLPSPIASPTQPSPDPAALEPASLEPAERRVLIERVGALSGRMTRVESEAAVLAVRLGLPSVASGAASDTPGGGPLVPLAGDDTPPRATLPPVSDRAFGIAELERDLERLEAELADMHEAALEHELARMALPNRLPVPGRKVTSGFGTRRDPLTGRLARHTGLDIPAPRGTAILASGGGRVRSAGYNGAYGNTVIIDHGAGLATLYGHASRLYVRKGDIVMPQQRIAAVGSTGRSTGPHLHFEVIRNGRRVAPEQYLAVVPGRKHGS